MNDLYIINEHILSYFMPGKIPQLLLKPRKNARFSAPPKKGFLAFAHNFRCSPGRLANPSGGVYLRCHDSLISPSAAR